MGGAQCASCTASEGWGWLARVWGVFLLCWSGLVALLLLLTWLRARDASAPLHTLLWGSSCSVQPWVAVARAHAHAWVR